MTVKDLRESLKGLPDDTLVHIERIHDVYFEKYNWDCTVYDWGNGEGLEFTAASSTAKPKEGLVICAHI
jgi:hypothetical protein